LSQSKTRARDAGRNAQLVRALQIVTELERAGGLSLQELAENFGTSTRTIRRDLEALQSAGFLFEAEQPDQRKLWRLERGGRARKLNRLLDKSHFFALRMAMSLGGPLRPGTSAFTALEDLSDKIETALGREGRDQLKAIDRCFYSYEKHAYKDMSRELLWRIVAAIEQQRVCRVTYRRPQPEAQDKQIDVLPLRIFAHQGAAYLMCQFMKHTTLGTLNLQRVRDFVLTREQARAPDDFDPEKMEGLAFGVHTGTTPVTYRLRFDAGVAAYIRERTWHPTQELRELEHGAVELQFTCGESWEVSSWVASWRQHVEVLEPETLRIELRQLGAALLERYR